MQNVNRRQLRNAFQCLALGWHVLGHVIPLTGVALHSLSSPNLSVSIHRPSIVASSEINIIRSQRRSSFASSNISGVMRGSCAKVSIIDRSYCLCRLGCHTCSNHTPALIALSISRTCGTHPSPRYFNAQCGELQKAKGYNCNQ